jgi:O-antigen ligase
VSRRTGLLQSERTTAALIAGYVALWILEGAFRKWVPSMGMVFYVLRDGYAVAALVWLAVSRRTAVRRLPWWTIGVALILGLLLVAQFLQSQSTAPVVLLFGLRSYVAPLLFAVLCYQYATFASVMRIGAVIAAAAPLELALTIAQVRSAPDSFINVQVGGEPNDFVNGNAVVRATGTFSAPSGLTVYVVLALAFGLWWTVLHRRRLVGLAVVSCVVATIALSGARGSVLEGGILIGGYLVYSIVRPSKESTRTAVLIIVVLAVLLVVVQLALPTVIEAFIARFTQASASEDSSARVLDGFSGFLGQTPSAIGDGMGTRSNAGIALGSPAGWIENDSLRWIAELGVLGFCLAVLRVLAVIVIVAIAIVRVRRDGPALTMLRAALVVLLVLGSINDTPTSEGGFGILLGAYLLALTTRTGSTPQPAPPKQEVRRREVVAR